MKRFPESEYHIPFFDEEGYVRKLCPKCGEYFWTQNPDQETCGEATPERCAPYTFIGNPPTRRSYSYREMREAFLSFFEERGHARIKPYPVVARWRDDLFFTHASIIDFQPYVTEGVIPPPANPLVISQPCLRFVDVDNVGLTFGRHLTIFEMGGAHAFNTPTQEVYWKDQTVRYHHEFLVKELGVKSEEIVYKEGVWIGGGNAGPDVESIVRGLEVATLVFMQFKVVGEEFIQLPIRTVDTGYGIERFTWLSQGCISCFHAVYGPLLDELLKIANLPQMDWGLVEEVAKLSGFMNLEKGASRLSARRSVAEILGVDALELDEMLTPLEAAFAVVDHTKSLAFMLAEGVIPSNVREGYLARLLLRRTYKLLRVLGAEDRLLDLVDAQIDYWSVDYPHLREMRDAILEMLSIEEEKFRQTLRRGSEMARRMARSLRERGVKSFPREKLVELYDSHGIPPEVVKEVVEKEGVKVEVPDDFYMEIAGRHVSAPVKEEPQLGMLGVAVEDLPATKPLYYEEPRTRRFKATVLRVVDGKYVVLDKTAFYPTGGGQLSDVGYLEFNGRRAKVVDVLRVGKVVVHVVEGVAPREGMEVVGEVDWTRRMNLTRHHTATHILLGAARRVLGSHVWQAGAQKEPERSRLDISHYKRVTMEEVHEIERLANRVVMMDIPVEVRWMPREEAERLYGFRLYQGGVVPGREIRVVKIGDWDVEACGGTHCRSTGEVGLIKILHTERVQDGVERLVFAAGLPALEAVQRSEATLRRISEAVGSPVGDLERVIPQMAAQLRDARREAARLSALLARYEAREYLERAVAVDGVRVIAEAVERVPVSHLIEVAREIVDNAPDAVVALIRTDETANVVVMVGRDALQKGIKASFIASEAARPLGGRGSGRDDFAQGGGPDVRGVPEALKVVRRVVAEAVGG